MYPGRIPGRVRIGMTAPLASYSARLADVGQVYAQRVFCTALDDDEVLAISAAAQAGRLPIVSFKVGDWAKAASGAVDSQAGAALDRLAGIGPVVVAFHHEPSGDGTPADFAAMQARLLPLARARGLSTALILNGFWWGAKGGYSDAQIGAYLPDLALVDVVAADCYESDRNTVADLFTRFLAWADRAGVRELGVGEWGCRTADGITAAGQVLLANQDRFGWACYFNSPRNSREDWTLSGDRLAAFQALRDASTPPEPEPTPTPEPDPRDAQIADLTAQVTGLQASLAQAQADTAAAVGRAQTAETLAAGLQAKITAAIADLS
jgi:hypothetical protein